MAQSGPTLLIVDDNVTNLKVLLGYLKGSDFNILSARDGEDGLMRAELGLPDLILLDIQMPGIDGFETCRRLKSNPITRNIPVIFMTALERTEDKVRGFEVGAVDYITKPIDQAEVIARINTHLTLDRLQKELRRTNESLEVRVADRTHRLQVRATLSQAMNEIQDLDALLMTLTRVLADSFDYHQVQIIQVNDELSGLTLSHLASCPEYPDEDVSTLSLEESIVGEVIETKRAVLKTEISPAGSAAEDSQGATQSHLALPLRRANEVTGVLEIYGSDSDTFSDKDVSMLQSIADEMAIAIDNIKLQAEREETIDKLLELDRAKTRFLRVLSHELRTPMNAVLGYTELLLEGVHGDLDPPVIKTLDSIRRSGRHMTDLVNNLLDIARIEVGQLQILLAPFQDLYYLLSEIENILNLLVGDKPIEIIIEAPRNIPPICADRQRLYQILLNLGHNAVKFTDEGSIGINVDLDPDAADKLKFSVIDTGAGMSPDQFEVIFEPFKLVDMSMTRQHNGLGLGLAISKQLVAMHGGELCVKSAPGQGATFYFSIPFAPCP